MRAIVLAGGLGTRLRAAVPDLPKPLAPIGGRPFLAWLIEYLARQGITAVTLSVGHGADAILDYFGDAHAGLAVSYVRETEPLGTGGAARCALASLEGAEPVFVLNGDTLNEVDYRALMAAHCDPGGGAPGSSLTVVLREVDSADRYSPVEVEGARIARFSAPGRAGPALINGGVYVMAPQLLDAYPEAHPFSLEADFLEPRAAALGARAWVTQGFFIDIGMPDDYERAQELLPRFLARD